MFPTAVPLCASFVLAATGIFSALCLDCEFTSVPGNPPGVIPSHGTAREELGKHRANLAQLFPPRALLFLSCLASLLTEAFLETGPVFFVTWLLARSPRCQSLLDFPGCSDTVPRDAGGVSLCFL